MLSEQCPGCNRAKIVDDLCCDSCWGRLPVKLGGRTWRRRRQTAAMVRDWHGVELINKLICGWLLENREVSDAQR